MEFFISGRKTGKTSSLIDWLQQAPEGENRVVITHTEDARLDLLRRAKERNVDIEDWQVISVYYRNWLLGRSNVVLAVDNLDLTLGALLGTYSPIQRVTATGTLFNHYD